MPLAQEVAAQEERAQEEDGAHAGDRASRTMPAQEAERTPTCPDSDKLDGPSAL